jgi:hypothetical protein
MSAGREFDDALLARQPYAGLNEQRQSPPLAPAIAADWNDQAQAPWIDQFELKPTAREFPASRSGRIRLDRNDRAVLVSGESFRERAVRAAIVVALLTVTGAGLAWVGGSDWIRVPAPAPAPAASRFTAPIATPVPANPPEPTIADLAARESAPKVLPKAPESTKLHALTPTRELPVARPQTQPQRAEQPERRILAPVPETRPATIPGWSVREVAGDSALLDGPHGSRRVARGETVPGLGRIETIVRWGNRWIVTTERGLISTN